MTILCIGRSGQVAQSLAERAAERGISLTCVGRPDFDLLNRDMVDAQLTRCQPSLIINAAAYTNVDGAESNKQAAFDLNASAPRDLAEICQDRGLPLIHLSTDYVFDGRLDQAYREDDLTGPLSVYGASKLEGERYVRETMTRHIILRTSWVYSPFGANFAKTMLRLAKERGGASVVDDQYGAPTSALDIADTILTIAETLSENDARALFGTYHYAAAGAATWADFAALIFDLYDRRMTTKTDLKRIPSVDYPTPAARPKNSRLSTAKITKTFGIKPKDWTFSATSVVNRLLDQGAA